MKAAPSLLWRLLAITIGGLGLMALVIGTLIVTQAARSGSGEYDLELQDAARSMADALAPAPVTEVPKWAAAIDHFLNGYEQGRTARQAMAFEVNDAGGAVVYRSLALAAMMGQTDAAMPGREGSVVPLKVGGVEYHVALAERPPWTVRVVTDRDRLLSAHARVVAEDLLIYLGLGGLLLVPLVGLAAWLGLRPLHRLTREISRRAAGDLRPLTEPGSYDETRQVATTLNTLLSATSQALQREQNFLRDAAHDLRTPMAALVAQARALVEAPDESTRLATQRRIDRAAERVARLSEQLLALAGIEQAAEAGPQTFDLVALVQDTLSDFEDRAVQTAVEFELQAPASLIVTLERSTWLTVLDNLIDNAINHGGSGGRVDVQIDADEQRWRLSIRDRGPGIAPADQLAVFVRFFRGRDQAKPGAGLGLAIVATACKRLNIGLRLRSLPEVQGVEWQIDAPRVD